MLPGEKGGVEEKKDDSMDNLSPNLLLRHRQSSDEPNFQPGDESDDEQTYGFHARLQRLANVVFGTCGSLIEAASCFVSQQGCRWPLDSPLHQPSAERGAQVQHNRPPLSIAEELRRMAQEDGNRNVFQPMQGFRRTDIPKFLGEEAVYSFDDDNISAISQHTLEEMARHGVIQAHRARRRQSSNPSPPPPTETNSGGSSESSGKLRKDLTKPPSTLRDDSRLEIL